MNEEGRGQLFAIQGYEGSFHQIAARNYIGKDVSVKPCGTFREVVQFAAEDPGCNGAFMAIENSIAGSILPNYSLLHKSGLRITGEIYLQINQHLMVNPNLTLDDIREVHSHPMALLQCMDYFERYPHWKLVESEDTALAAKHIHQHRHKHTAAVASELAAELYNLEIVAHSIQSNRNNYTRFLCLQKAGMKDEGQHADKASIRFNTRHESGALAKILTLIADEGVNLSKLQSMPIPEKQWQYSFHADLEFGSREVFAALRKKLEEATNELTVYGIYKKGLTIE